MAGPDDDQTPPRVTDVADLLTRGRGREPRQARRRRGRAGAGMTWAELDDEVGPRRVRPGRRRGRRGTPRDDRDGQPDRVRGVVPRDPAGAGRRGPGEPHGEGRRAGPDDRRLGLADRDRRRRRDRRGARSRGGSRRGDGPEHPAGSIEADLFSRLVRPRVVVVGATLQPGERSYDHLRAERAPPVPPLQDPEKLAALLYTSGTSGRPRAAMLTHRALLANIEQVAGVDPPMIHGDDVVLGVLPLFHVYGLNAVLGVAMHHRAKLVLAGRFDPQGTLDLIEDEACSVIPVAPPVFAYWREVEQLRERLGPVRLMLSGSAPLSPELMDEFTALTGIPIHQGYGLTEASPVVTSHPRQQDPAERLGRGGPARRRGPAGRRARAPARGRGPRPDLDPRRQPVQRLLARRRRRPGRRGLVVHRRRRLPRPERRPVPGRPAQGARHRLGLQRLPGRGRGRHRGGRRRGGGRGDRCRRRAPGRGGGGLRRGARADSDALAAAVREHCETRLARFKQPSRVEIVGELPVDRDRQGPEGPAARHRAATGAGPARVTARVTLYGKPGCHLCDDARAVVAQVCADLGESYAEISIDDDPAARSNASARRSR